MRIRTPHLTSAEVDAVVCPLLGRIGAGADEIIPDNVAVTVASWWQSPRGTGSSLAALASGAEVSPHAVAEDVTDSLAEWRSQTLGVHADHATREDYEWNGTLLNLLSAWAEDRVMGCRCADCAAERAADLDADARTGR